MKDPGFTSFFRDKMSKNVNKFHLKLIKISSQKWLLNMITLRFNNCAGLLVKRWPAPLDFFIVDIPERSSNGSLKRLDRRVRMRGCIRMFFNHAKQRIVTYIKVWWAARANVFRYICGKVLLQVSLDLFCNLRWRRVLNEHDFVKIVVFTNPGQKNISQELRMPKFNKMRRHHLTIICISCKNHHWNQNFALNHRKYIWSVTSNNSRVIHQQKCIRLLPYFWNGWDVKGIFRPKWLLSGEGAKYGVFSSRISFHGLHWILYWWNCG